MSKTLVFVVAVVAVAVQAGPPARAGTSGNAAGAAPAHAAPAASASASGMQRLQQLLEARLGTQAHASPQSPGELAIAARSPDAAGSAPKRRHAPARRGHAAGAARHWSYEGADGPQAWGQIEPAFAACANGRRQSPIDLRETFMLQLDPVQFDYQPSAFRVVDNGHTIEARLAPGSSIRVMGRRYELIQFHFHRPSEERIDGRAFDMTAHLVHRDPEGRLAVVAVLLERGQAQPVVQAVWNNLPLEKGEELAAQAPIDPGALLPAERGYFVYMGSLTTPPCTEGVLWMVMKQPVPIAPQQIDIFARLYPMNARPLQPAAGRIVKESQ